MLSFEAISVTRGGRRCLHSVSGNIEKGQLIALVGENGAGKSTLLHALAGNINYTGKVKFLDKELSSWNSAELALKRAVLNQHHTLNFAFGVPELVAMGRFQIPETKKQCYSEVNRYLELLDLTQFTARNTQQLSGGELQRVQMARCLAQLNAFNADCQNRLMLLDEPTSALDIHHQHRLLKLVRQFVNEGNTAVVAIHDLNLASLYADHTLLLSQGELVRYGRTEEVLTQQVLEPVYRTPMHITVHPTLDKPIIFTEPGEEFHETASSH